MRPVHRCRNKQIFGGAKDFCPNFPKLAQKVVFQLLWTVFWCDLEKMVFTCFSANVGRHFCPNFQQIKYFEGALASSAPSPPTPLGLWSREKQFKQPSSFGRFEKLDCQMHQLIWWPVLNKNRCSTMFCSFHFSEVVQFRKKWKYFAKNEICHATLATVESSFFHKSASTRAKSAVPYQKIRTPLAFSNMGKVIHAFRRNISPSFSLCLLIKNRQTVVFIRELCNDIWFSVRVWG